MLYMCMAGVAVSLMIPPDLPAFIPNQQLALLACAQNLALCLITGVGGTKVSTVSKAVILGGTASPGVEIQTGLVEEFSWRSSK